MIDGPLASGAVVHANTTNASNFAIRFAKLLCDLVRQSRTGTAKPRYTPTVEKLCRAWSVEDAMNQIIVEGGTDFSAHHGLLIFSEMIHWLSRDVDLAPGDLDYTGASGGFGAVVADNLLHAQTDGLHLTDLIS